MTELHILLESIDLGDHVIGVFDSRENGEEALIQHEQNETERLGKHFKFDRSRYRIELWYLNELMNYRWLKELDD